MKLTSRMLEEHLRERFRVLSAGGKERAVVIEGVLLCGAETVPEEGWAYVGAGHLSVGQRRRGSRDAMLIFLKGETEPDGAPVPGPYVVLDGTADTAEVVNFLTRLWKRYERWEETLGEIEARRGSVSDMLEASLPLFGNPLVLFGNDMTLCGQAGIPGDRDAFRIFSSGRMRMDAVNAVLQDESYAENIRKTEVYPGPDYITGIRTLNWNIRSHHETAYILEVLEDGRILSAADGDRLRMLGAHIRTALSGRDGGGKGRTLKQILQRVLTDRTLDYMEASRELELAGWAGADTYFCLVYQLTYLDRRAIPVMSICEYMEEQYPCCSSQEIGKEIVTFFHLTEEGPDQDEILTGLRPFIRDSYLKAGFSRTMRGHMHLRRQYIQAGIALDVGSRRDPYLWIHYFDRLAFSYLMEQMTRRLPREMVVHPGTLALSEYDREHGTDYVRTLRTYLDRQCNAVQSAKDLYIHRSTFLYRMEKIREITESTLTDPEEVLYISLSLHLLMRSGENP